MKRLLVIGMVLVFASSMFALESDPSEVVGYVTYGCETTDGTDLNFIALPMNSGYVMASALGDAIGACDVVNVWDPAGQGWLSASDLGFMWAGDFALNAGYSYMVNVTADTDVYIYGGMITQPTYNLVTTDGTDLNSIMVPVTSIFGMASELGNDIGVCDVVNNWDATGQGWLSASDLGFMWAGDFAIEIGMPLMVNVTADVTWPVGRNANTNANSVRK